LYSRAFLRFWWVLALGLVAAIAVGGIVAKRHRPPTFSTYSQLLVDSAQHPFLRTGITANPGGGKSTTSSKLATNIHQSVSPDTQSLVSAANFYPMLINSDVVGQYRQKHYGVIPGVVKAKAVDAVQGQNRYVPSIFPVIEIDSAGPSAEDAIQLSTVTAEAFQKWLVERQNSEAIPAKQRISVVPIVMPTTATEVKHTRYSLALVAGAAIFAVFLGLAVLLDRVWPRKVTAEAPEERYPESARRVDVAQRIGSSI